ncbi:MAG: oligoribonuclease, partial [Proteobacteria bacterium]
MSNKRLFWIDLEMTGLDEKKDRILEVAVIITDLEFRTLATYRQVVFQSQDVVDNMNDWCKIHHGNSGLTAEIPNGKPSEDVEKDLIALTKQYFHSKERVVLVGNSISNDRRFIDEYWKEFAKLLHYRMIDVSSYKEIFRDKYAVTYDKKNAHRAEGDIL